MRLPTAKLSAPAAAARTAALCAGNALCAALCAAALVTTPLPASAAPTLNEAIVEVSQTSYPVLKSLQPSSFPKFTEKVGGLLLDINADKLGKAIGLYVEVLNSAPQDKLDAFTGDVKEAFKGLSPSDCTLVPLPAPVLADKFGAVASAKVDAAVLKTFGEKYGPALGALATSEGKAAVCLPSAENLDKLALSQADLARSFGATEAGRFASYTTPLLKSSITLGKVLPLVSDAKKLTPTATPKQLADFQSAGKRIEQAATAEAQRAKLAELKARSAAIEAAKAAGKPVPVAGAAGARNPVQQEELEAARAKAAAETKAKKEAAVQEAAQKKAAQKEAELARIAELKAKSAAVQAAKEQK